MRIGVFYDEKLPYIGLRPDICELLKDNDFTHIHAENISEKFAMNMDCVINLQGQYFPEELWLPLKAHLKNGGGLLQFGPGSPFSLPMYLKDGKWEVGRHQTCYHEELNIIGIHKVSKDTYSELRHNAFLPILKDMENCFSISDTSGMVVQFTKHKDTPLDAGSSGPMDANITSLLSGFSSDGRETAAPVVLIENTKGEFAGGRWIFANITTDKRFWDDGGYNVIKQLASYAGNKVYEFILRPNYASYYEGEQPTILFNTQYYGEQPKKAGILIEITKKQEEVYHKYIESQLIGEARYESLPLNFSVSNGVYKIRTTLSIEGEVERILENGFWGYDKELLVSGDEIKCGRDYFIKDNVPMPVVGMTYMQADVHRKFLYLPNVAIWERDFKEMKRAGINMVRTGVWTAHRTLMFNDGIPDEAILRVFDAMILTASKHDIVIVINFFAFTPELWEGSNPYLDPRSIQAQKRFISSIVSRHISSKHVMWDFINEPSVCNPRSLWHPYPNGDRFETKAWQKWLENRHGNISELRRCWNCSSVEIPSFNTIKLPDEDSLNDRRDFPEHRKGLIYHDYVLFTQHVFNEWVRQMTATIRGLGAEHLITVGQDEALNANRPSPLIYEQTVDYTTCHSWWLMDDIYWNSVFNKSPGKPNLIQETGIMYLPQLDGLPRRNEEDLRDVLERKYALAFAGANAGAVQWIWNTNVYMDSINEVNIGALRADGSQKPEALVSYDFGAFFKAVGPKMKARKTEEVAVVFPYSNSFSLHNMANEATKRLCRVLSYNLDLPFKVLSEYDLCFTGDEKLLILPTPGTISQQAYEKLIEQAKKGATLLITGSFSKDEYFRKINERSQLLGFNTVNKAVCREEAIVVDDITIPFTYSDKKIAWVDKEVVCCPGLDEEATEPENSMPLSSDNIRKISVGKGWVIWTGMPIEMNDREDSVVAFYKYIIKAVNLQPEFEWILEKPAGVLARKLQFDECNLYIYVSEGSSKADLKFRDIELDKNYGLTLEPQRIAMFATDKSGHIIKSYKDYEINEF